MAITEYTPEIQQLGRSFYQQGMEQLDNIVYGQEDAKTAILAGLVARTAVMLAGPPGGGKSRLSRNVHRIFEDINPSEVAVVPPASDLLPIELVGGTMNTSKKVHSNGQSFEETTTHTVDPIIKTTHKIIWNDELTRINPEASNQLLSIPEEKELKTRAGIVALPNFQLMLSTMNASETRQATFPVSAALASRHKVGAIMSKHNVSKEDRTKLVKGIKPNPESIVPFANIPQLDKLRDAVANLAMGDAEAERGVELAERTENLLLDNYGIEEELRLDEQAGEIARILALFEGKVPQEQHLNDSIRFILAARLGSRVARREAIIELNNIHEQIIAA